MKVGLRQSLSASGDLYFWPGRPVRSAITVGAGGVTLIAESAESVPIQHTNY